MAMIYCKLYRFITRKGTGTLKTRKFISIKDPLNKRLDVENNGKLSS